MGFVHGMFESFGASGYLKQRSVLLVVASNQLEHASGIEEVWPMPSPIKVSFVPDTAVSPWTAGSPSRVQSMMARQTNDTILTIVDDDFGTFQLLNSSDRALFDATAAVRMQIVPQFRRPFRRTLITDQTIRL